MVSFKEDFPSFKPGSGCLTTAFGAIPAHLALDASGASVLPGHAVTASAQFSFPTALLLQLEQISGSRFRFLQWVRLAGLYEKTKIKNAINPISAADAVYRLNARPPS